MTIEQSQATIWPTNMDLYGNTPHSSDHMLPTDIYPMDPFPNAYSPNSPHMYEQEKEDLSLLCQLESQSLQTGNRTHNSVNMEEFDLKPHFENNADNFASTSVFDLTSGSPGPQFTTDTIWDKEKDFDEIFQGEKTDDGPTLAELNFGEFLMDDFTCDEIYSYSGVANSSNEAASVSGTPNVSGPSSSNVDTTNTGSNVASTACTNIKDLHSNFLVASISNNSRSELQTSTVLQQSWDENPTTPTLGMSVQSCFNASSTKSSKIFQPLKQNSMAPSCTITCDTVTDKNKTNVKLFGGNGTVLNKPLKQEDFSPADCCHNTVVSGMDTHISSDAPFKSSLQQLLCSNQPPIQAPLQPQPQTQQQQKPQQKTSQQLPQTIHWHQPQQITSLPSQTPSQPPLQTQQPSTPLPIDDPMIPNNGTTNNSDTMDEKWEQIKQFIHKEDSPRSIKRERISSTSSFTASNDDHDSNDGDMSDNSNESGIEDYLSDEEYAHSQSPSGKETQSGTVKRKEKQYFWQYNVQSKGPKGQRMRLLPEEQDPHVLNTFEDPVFELGTTSKLGLRHSGKARRGDGNDISPNPRKLHMIGLQLKKLNHDINEFVPTSELPANIRNRTRKEKNKLASRACRLKKKAQHEANKVKLYGLEQEHRQLMTVIESIKQRMLAAVRSAKTVKCEDIHQGIGEEQAKYLDELIKRHLTIMIAGHTADYVNKVLGKVKSGDITGGLPLPKRKSSSAMIASSDDELSND